MSVLGAQRVTLAEFEVMTEAHVLRRVDDQYNIHLQAWTISQAQATDKKGKPHFKNFDNFFDYEKAIKKAKGDVKKIENTNADIDLYKRLAQLNKAGG